jgi:hypothetical protein
MKTIIEMAREADPKANLSEPYCLDHETRAWLERFAELVRADEREACAKVCDDNADIEHWQDDKGGGGGGSGLHAKLIRARGQA